MSLNNEVEDDSGPGGFAHGLLIYLVGLLVAVPLFLILYPYVPELIIPMGQGYRVDHILTFVLVLVAMVVLVRKFQLLVYALLVLGLAGITITSMAGGYGFKALYHDYALFLHTVRESTRPLPIARTLRPFADGDLLLAKVDHSDPQLRTFAVLAATSNFSELAQRQSDPTLIQCFSIFKEINSHWRYVNDVKGGEYFAKASESAQLLAGDCDDHAVLMVACIKAIGGQARLVRTTGHIYPELLVGNAKDMERVAWLIRTQLFKEQAAHANLFYHTDEKGQRWINMDYTRDHPGGEVMEEDIVGTLDV
ncbi:MAG: transglutaminase family protein [Flavobacteriales bacterium]|nr:transglutaminase family protein [Flavobacteriales bacterium]